MLKLEKLLYNILIITFQSLIIACGSTPKIGHEIPRDGLMDGIYVGDFKSWPNFAKVKVTIHDQKIVQIQIIKHGAWKGKKAEPIILERIIEKQSTDVDVVTGATNSSHVMMNAVQKAIEGAYAIKK